MGLYRYSAADGDTVRSGEVAAASLPQAIRSLQTRGVNPTELAEARRDEPVWGRLGNIERIWLYRHLADLLESGVTLAGALDVLAQDAPTSANAARLRTMSQLVASRGLTMAEAMEQYPRLFGNYGIAIARTAEAANRLPQSLRMIATYLENSGRINERLWIPAVYPIILLTIMIGVNGFLTTFIVPKFIDLFSELGMTHDQFPFPTRVTIAISHVLPPITWALLILLLLLAGLYLFTRKSKRVQLDLAIWSLWLPIFGRLNRDCATARILGMLSLAIDAGMPLDEALEASGPAASNELMSLAMRRAADRARRGHSAAEAISAARILPPALLWHVQTAERAGNLPEACRKLSQSYLERAQMHTSYIAATLEPLLIIFVGLCVGTIGYSIFLPLVGIIGELSS